MESSCFTHQQDQVSMTSGPYSQMMGSSTAGTSFARGADTGAAFSSTAASFAAANDTSFAPGVGAETTVAAPAPAPPFFRSTDGTNLFGDSTSAPPAPAPGFAFK